MKDAKPDSLSDIIARVTAGAGDPASPENVPRGRTLLLTAALQEKMCNLFRAGQTRADVAAWNGVGTRTFYTWLSRGKAGEEPFASFRNAVLQAEAEARIRMVRVIFEAAQNDPKWALEYLRRRDRANWGDRLDLGTLTNEQLAWVLTDDADADADGDDDPD